MTNCYRWNFGAEALGVENARRACPGGTNLVLPSVSDRLPKRRTGTIEEARHPTAPTSCIVILADRLAHRWCKLDLSHTALADFHVAALIPRLQIAVETEFHPQSLAAHSSLYRGARDLVAAAG